MEEEDHWPLDEPRFKGKKTSACCVIATVLGVILIFALLAVVGLSVALKLEQNEQAPLPSTCLTPECVELGNQILSSLDESVNPCDDFYKFSCNRFLKQAIVPYGATSTGPLEKLMGGNQERFRALMESGNNRSVEALQKAITYYQSCIDQQAIEEQTLSALTQVLTDLGGWPLVGLNHTVREWSINDQDGFLTEILYGSSAFFGLTVAPNPHNSSENILAVDQGGLTFPALDVYLSNRDLLRGIMMEVLMAINPDISDEEYSTAVDDVLDFETAIANITDFDALRRDYVDKINVTDFATLIGYMPTFNWTGNLEYYGKLGGFSVNTSAPVNVLAPSRFLIQLNSLISGTDAVTLQNYAKWQLVYKLLPALSREFSDIHYSLIELLTGEKEPPRYKTCVSNIEQQMPLALARAFTEQYFPPEVQGNMSVVLKELKLALKERIAEKDWLDNSTKQHALNKAETIKDFLAYPMKILDTAFLNSFYTGLVISASDGYFVNYLNGSKFSMLGQIATMAHANNRSSWNLGLPFPPTYVNAAYYPYGNQIYILEGILNIPFFEPYWPDYFKFGTIGFVVGHELVHGFDNSGRKFDEFGNLVQWWSPGSEDAFNKKAKCFIDQYNQYSLPAGEHGAPVHMNGTLTLGENIADNGGIATAFLAYKNRVDKTQEVQTLLPGLSYNPDQLFFIASAQPWCQVASLQKQLQLLQDVHTPSSLRPLGLLSNSAAFAAAFQCPKDSRMNPSHKCEIW